MMMMIIIKQNQSVTTGPSRLARHGRYFKTLHGFVPAVGAIPLTAAMPEKWSGHHLEPLTVHCKGQEAVAGMLFCIAPQGVSGWKENQASRPGGGSGFDRRTLGRSQIKAAEV